MSHEVDYMIQQRLECPSRTKVSMRTDIAWDMGFKGCDNGDPDLCSCGTFEDTRCERCHRLVEEGQRIVILTRHISWDGYPNDDEWEYEIRHETCPAVARC